MPCSKPIVRVVSGCGVANASADRTPGRLGDRALGRQRFATADRDAPETAVDRVGRTLCRQRQVVRFEVGELFVAHPAVVAHRREDLEARHQRAQRNLEAHLVVAGRRAAVGDRRRAAFFCECGKAFGLQSTLGADTQGIGLAAQHVAGDQETDDVVEEGLLRIDQHVFYGAELQRALFQRFGGARVDAAGVDARGNDFAAVVLLQPRHAERRIEAAGKGKNDRGGVGAHRLRFRSGVRVWRASAVVHCPIRWRRRSYRRRQSFRPCPASARDRTRAPRAARHRSPCE